MAKKTSVTLKELTTELTSDDPPISEEAELIDNEVELEDTVQSEVNHTHTSKKIFNQIRTRLSCLVQYFNIPFNKSGLIYHRSINEDYSVIKIKFLYTRKKILIVFTNDEIRYGFYTRTTDIVKNISSIYELTNDEKILTFEDLSNKLGEILFWGFYPESRDKNIDKALGISINENNYKIENRAKHLLYYGVIVNYKIIKTITDEYDVDHDVVEFKFLDDDNTYKFEIPVDISYKLMDNYIFVVNYRGDCNIFNFKGVKSFIDFSSYDYRHIMEYIASLNPL